MDSVFFDELNGKKIFCYLSEPERVQNKIVIMCHGFRGSSVGPARAFVDFARILVKEGYSVLRFDQPNSSNSDGNFLDVSFTEWVDATKYFTGRYLARGYKVALLGQSMGGTVSTVVSARPELRGRILCLLLWAPGVPDPRYDIQADMVYEEVGQKYGGKFWLESREANFIECLGKYTGAIHLVYGEDDGFMTRELREQVISEVAKKGQRYMILKGQGHSSWDYDQAQEVYKEELGFLKEHLH